MNLAEPNEMVTKLGYRERIAKATSPEQVLELINQAHEECRQASLKTRRAWASTAKRRNAQLRKESK